MRKHKNTKRYMKDLGSNCVSADANGPRVLGNDCPDNYQYTVYRLNDEDLHGIKTEEPYGGDKWKKDSVGYQANKDKPIGELQISPRSYHIQTHGTGCRKQGHRLDSNTRLLVLYI